MTLSIANNMAADGGSIYYNQDWLDNVELHLPYLLGQASNLSLPLFDADTLKYRFDFFGLLAAYNQGPHLHHIIMRMNGLAAPTDYDGSLTTLIIPDNRVVGQLLSVWQASTQRLKKVA